MQLTCGKYIELGLFRTLIHAISKMPYKRYLRDQLTAALDVFFTILHVVDLRISVSMQRNGENWRLQNACLPCTYRVRTLFLSKKALLT
jgi:hypothetical protein